MAPLTRDPEMAGQTNTGAPVSAKPLPVAMEIPVTVNGASTVAGSEKREPFSETTQTVLVFGSGAVIRLAAAVGPGQLLFVTNEKSKQEVVCQVVKTKQNGSTGGYVELKFTEATTDFWGIRTPDNDSGSAATAGSIAGVPVKSLEQKLADLKTATPAATQITPQPIAPPPAPTPVASAPPIAALNPTPIPAPAAPANEIPAAPDVPAQPPASRVPTLSEFLTHGSNGPELKAPEKGSPGKNGNREAAPAAVLTKEKPVPVSTAPSQVSARDDQKPSLSAALGVSQSVAPGAASFDLSADLPTEELKIPAWLEPLARNASIPENKPTEAKLAEAKPPVPVNAGAAQNEEASVTATISADIAQDVEAVPVLASEGRSPNFGTSLSLGSQAEGAPSSGSGWKIGLAIAALLLAAAAMWYWYVNQPPKVSAGGNSTVAGANPESVPAPAPSMPASEPVRASTVTPTANRSAESALLSQPAASTAGSTRPAGNNSSAVKDTSNVPAYDAPVEPAKKPALGEVRLAAPKVTRKNQAEESGAADPGLALNGVTAADSSSLSILTNKSKGPAAPLPVGGDVKVARLLSSVPPVYPQMARAQRVSGDVTIDALIDVNGRVSATRVISGPTLLHEAAMGAVRQWKYLPATLNGIPTATHLTVTVQFRLQ
jgi:TonB family protein